MRVTLAGMSFRDGRRLLGTLVYALVVLSSTPVRTRAQEASQTSVELSFTPTDRAQIAVWVERDGVFMGTLALTHAVAVAGIGNRPGALQFNSGYRWPYGRREGVLPVWAHRRASAPDARQFRRVIFQNRASEGAASRTNSQPDYSVDEYYCLSFKDGRKSREEQLDAVTCASVFSSDKGRFLNDADVMAGYAEPTESEQHVGSMRPLSATSLYPPRRDVTRCARSGCADHVDVAAYVEQARDVMPELDAISRATPESARLAVWNLPIPDAWPMDGEYVLYIEANVEGDYNDVWSAARFPTPKLPEKAWDSWSKDYGYPYRGQPSVVYALPFRLSAMEGATEVGDAAGYGALEGEDGELRPMDDTISDDPQRAPGSGADRLRKVRGVRASLQVRSVDPCSLPEPPDMCGVECSGDDDRECGALVCDPASGTCGSFCTATVAPERVTELQVTPHPDKTKAHMWAQLAFRVAESERGVAGYDVRVRPEGGDWSPAYTHDSTQELLPVALDVCSDPDQPSVNRCLAMQVGTNIAVDLAGLRADTRYTVSVAARDAMCGELGDPALAQFETPERTFTTVSPCFIATAAYGSPLAREVSALRAVRDRYLASHAPGRMLIDAYYAIGPFFADAVRAHPWLRAGARAVIWPVTSLSAWWIE
ncbi:MAG: CFI-box-CTERM domain-containing protein [Polyangiales bacterium]